MILRKSSIQIHIAMPFAHRHFSMENKEEGPDLLEILGKGQDPILD